MLSAFASLSDDLRPALGENPEGIISGEWPENFSLLSFDDLRAYLETQIISEKVSLLLPFCPLSSLTVVLMASFGLFFLWCSRRRSRQLRWIQ